jgi:ferrous-iron efflux pump FieF
LRREPTADELTQERILLVGLWLDFAIWLGYGYAATQSGLLTILAECVKSGLTLGLTVVAVAMLRRINRGHLADYDFGTGKVEQALSLLTAIAVAGGAIYIGIEVYHRIAHGVDAVPQDGLPVVFGVLVIDLVVDLLLLGWLAHRARGVVSPVFVAEHRGRIAHCAVSVAVLSGLGIALLFGPEASHWADTISSALLAVFMAWLAYGIVRRALPDLLDKTLSDELQMVINRALAMHFDRYDSLGRVRSRQAGPRLMVEIELGFPASMTLGEVGTRLAAIQADLERDLPGGHVVLIPTVALTH